MSPALKRVSHVVHHGRSRGLLGHGSSVPPLSPGSPVSLPVRMHFFFCILGGRDPTLVSSDSQTSVATCSSARIPSDFGHRRFIIENRAARGRGGGNKDHANLKRNGPQRPEERGRNSRLRQPQPQQPQLQHRDECRPWSHIQ